MWGKCGANLGQTYYLCCMASLKFIIRSNTDTANIYVRLKEGRLIDVQAKTNFIINTTDWSTTKGQPKNLKDASLKKLNNDLVNLQAELLAHYNNHPNKLDITTQWLKDF